MILNPVKLTMKIHYHVDFGGCRTKLKTVNVNLDIVSRDWGLRDFRELDFHDGSPVDKHSSTYEEYSQSQENTDL